MTTARAAALTLAALLTGCAVYQPRTEVVPRVELRESFLESGTQASDRWWEDFEDPKLSRVVETTLTDNLSLRMAWSRLAQMEAVARIAGAPRYPSADLALGAEREKLGGDQTATPYGSQDDTVDTAFASLTVAYQVDLWRKIGNSRKAALFDVQASRQDVEATALAMSGAAGELWYAIAAEQATLELLDGQLEVGNDFLDLVQLRFANGLASAVEVFQQRLQVETTRNQIPTAVARLAVSRHQLAVLLGREPRHSTQDAPAGLPSLPSLPATGVPIEALRARPDVRAAELALVAADHRLAAAIADRYPSLSLSASVGGRGEDFSSVLDNWFLNLAGNLLAPLFDGGRRAAEADRNRAVVEERFYAWESTLLGACAEVENALATERALRETSRIQATQLDLADTSLERSRALYANGLTDYLTVLTSLQALQSLQRQIIGTQADLLSNRIQLHLALGGSWSRSLEAPGLHEEKQT